MNNPTPGPRAVPVKVNQLRFGDYFTTEAPSDTDSEGRPIVRHVKKIEHLPMGHTHVNGSACYPSDSDAMLVDKPVKPTKK